MQCDTVFKLCKDSLWRHPRAVRSRKWFRHMCNFCSISTMLSHRLSNCTLTVDLTRSLSHSYSGLISISLCNLILSWLISPWLSILVPSLQSSSYDSRVSFLTNSPKPSSISLWMEWNRLAVQSPLDFRLSRWTHNYKAEEAEQCLYLA